MKKIIVFLAGTLMVFYSTAQMKISEFKKMTAPQKARLIADSLKNTLKLSDQQYTKVYSEILITVGKAMPVLQSDSWKVTKGMKLKTIMADEEAKLRQLLTESQYALYQLKKKNAVSYYKDRKMPETLLFNVPGI